MSFRYLDIGVVSRVATIRILDPNDDEFVRQRHPMHRELRDVFPALADDPGVDAVVLGGGYQHFYPVPHFAKLAQLLSEAPETTSQIQIEVKQILQHIVDFDKPLVAGVSGKAIGMGAQLAFISDLLVASADTVFIDSHVPIGLASGDGATVIWPLVMGLARAKRHVLRGEPLGAAEAYRLGLITEVVDDRTQVLPRAQELASELAELPRDAFRWTKLAFNQWLKLGITVAFDVAAIGEIASYQSAVFQQHLRQGLES